MQLNIKYQMLNKELEVKSGMVPWTQNRWRLSKNWRGLQRQARAGRGEKRTSQRLKGYNRRKDLWISLEESKRFEPLILLRRSIFEPKRSLCFLYHLHYHPITESLIWRDQPLELLGERLCLIYLVAEKTWKCVEESYNL